MEDTIAAYHYTPHCKYLEMIGRIPGYEEGLKPQRGFILIHGWSLVPPEAYKPCISALLQPEAWKNNPESSGTWDNLMSHIYLHANIAEDPDMNLVTLIRIELSKTDNAHVAERAHFERKRYDMDYSYSVPHEEAARLYWESRVPLFDYQGGYVLPEVAVFNPVAKERLQEVWTRPMYKIWEQLGKRVKQRQTNKAKLMAGDCNPA